MCKCNLHHLLVDLTTVWHRYLLTSREESIIVQRMHGTNITSSMGIGKTSTEDNCKGQNSLDWGFPYIIGKLLECRYLKWACMTHLGTKNTSYGQKKGQKSNCQFDSQPLKVKNRPDSLGCMWRATYRWKAFNEGYNFF
jgi:hypothetical protein